MAMCGNRAKQAAHRHRIRLSADRFNRFQVLAGVFGNREVPRSIVYQASNVRLTFFKKAARCFSLE
jgi:hypothetical protein